VLCCAGQPSEAQLSFIAQNGVRLVVNLGLLGTDYALPREARTVEELGMAYVHLPVDFKQPTVADFEQFCAALNGRPTCSTLVHCALNYRASSFTALYLERSGNWSHDQAEELRHRFWQPDATWQEWAERVRGVV